MKDLSNLTSSQVDGLKVEKENEYADALQSCHTLQQEKLLVQRDILEKEMKKKNLDITLNKANHNRKQLEVEIKLLTHWFWRVKNSGL